MDALQQRIARKSRQPWPLVMILLSGLCFVGLEYSSGPHWSQVLLQVGVSGFGFLGLALALVPGPYLKWVLGAVAMGAAVGVVIQLA